MRRGRLALIGAGLLLGFACVTPEQSAERALFAGDGTWSASTFRYTERFDATAYDDYVVFDEEDFGGAEIFFGEERGTTAGQSGRMYREGEIRLPDGYVVPIDWDINDVEAPEPDSGGEPVQFWMLLYEDAGAMSAGSWTAYPAVITPPTVSLRFYTSTYRNDYEVEIVLQRR